jgi:death-on-curing protein
LAEGDGQEVAWLAELVGEIRELHDKILKTSGGAHGEHTARLFASCARPFQTAFGDDLFDDDVAKAAALLHGIVSNHPFVDGNKRTATLATLLFLDARNRLSAEPSPLHVHLLGEVALETARGHLTVEDVGDWLRRILAPSDQ